MTDALVLRHLDAAVDRVWRAFIDPDQLAAWFWSPSFATVATVEARVGGTFRVASSARDMAISGSVVAVAAPHHLETTWTWAGEAEQTRVAIDLAPAADGGTDLAVRHAGLPTAEAAREHEQGWSDCLDRLPAHLADPVG